MNGFWPYYLGWIVRIYHNLTREADEISSWKTLEKAVGSAGNHVDLCNVTEIVANRQMAKAYLNPTTWRWVNEILKYLYRPDELLKKKKIQMRIISY
jgi:hypothetical protein